MQFPSTSSSTVLARSTSGEQMVCYCRQVTEAAVRIAIDTGAKSVEQVQARTSAGDSCQGCHCRIQRMLMGLPAQCGRFALCCNCGCAQAVCQCEDKAA